MSGWDNPCSEDMTDGIANSLRFCFLTPWEMLEPIRNEGLPATNFVSAALGLRAEHKPIAQGPEIVPSFSQRETQRVP